MAKENTYDKLNNTDVEIEKGETKPAPRKERRDRRDGNKKWLILSLILVSSVSKIKNKEIKKS